MYVLKGCGYVKIYISCVLYKKKKFYIIDKEERKFQIYFQYGLIMIWE